MINRRAFLKTLALGVAGLYVPSPKLIFDFGANSYKPIKLVSYSELLALTIQELEDDLFDQIIHKNRLTNALKATGYICLDGGALISEPIRFTYNEGICRYS